MRLILMKELVPVTESYYAAFFAYQPLIYLLSSALILEVILLVIASLILLAAERSILSSTISGVRQAKYNLLWQARRTKFPGCASIY